MSSHWVLHQAKLAKAGTKLTWSGRAVLGCWVTAGLVPGFTFDAFPDNMGALIIMGIGAAGFAAFILRRFRLRKNSGDLVQCAAGPVQPAGSAATFATF